MDTTDPTATTATAPHVAAPGGDRSAWYSGWLLTFLATGAETGGRYSLTEVVGRRGHSAAPPPHVHTREDECFYVVEGAIDRHVGGEAVRVPAGGFVVLPRGVPHRYELASPEARLLTPCVPAGFEGFYRALSEPAPELALPPAPELALPPAPELALPPAPEGPPDVERLLAAAADHGVEILGPPPAEVGR